MNEAILKKYDIDPQLSTEEILDRLKSKNLELLERMDSSTDEARRTELRTEQQELEEVIIALSCTASLDRQVTQKRGGEGDPALQLALQSYQAHDYDAAFPVLEERAQQGDPLCCILTANILVSREKTADAKEYLYLVANEGNGAAAMQLAQLYQKENLLPPAVKWARVAVEQKEPGSRKLLAALLGKSGQHEEALQVRFAELDTATGFDRREILVDMVSLIKDPGVTSDVGNKFRDEVKAKLAGDVVNGEYWNNQTAALRWRARPRDSISAKSAPAQKAAASNGFFTSFPTLWAIVTTLVCIVIMEYIADTTGNVNVSWPAGVLPALLIFARSQVLSNAYFDDQEKSKKIASSGAIKAIIALIALPLVFRFAFTFDRDMRPMATIGATVVHFICLKALLK